MHWDTIYLQKILYIVITVVLFDKCQNKQRCQVAASTNVFRQDPCPKTSKYLKVTYKCNPSAFSNATVCEGEQLQLSCDRGTRIAVYSAMYGRTPSETSKCTNNNQRYADCRSSSALEQVMAVCHGQKKCAIEAQEYVFGNPCPKDIQKYLNVVYTCIPKKVLKQMRKIRHRNKKGRRKKGKKSTTVPNVTQENVSVSQSPSLVNKSTQNMYPADDSKQWNTDKTANLNVNNNNDKSTMTPSGEMTHSSVFCGNHSHLATPAPSSIGTGGSGMLVDWFNALNFLKENEEKAVLYMVLGITFGLLLLLIVIIIKLVVRNKRQRRTKLDVTDPVHMNSVPPDNHIEAPTLSRHDSMDRIEVVRFEPRSTLMRASLLDNGDRSLNHYYG